MKFLTALIIIIILSTIYVDAQPNGPVLSPVWQPVRAGTSVNLILKDQWYGNLSHRVLGAFNVTPELSLFGHKLGISLDGLTYAILATTNSKFFQNFAGVLDRNGVVVSTVFIPNQPYMVGLTMHFVGLTWDPRRIMGLGVSNRATMAVR